MFIVSVIVESNCHILQLLHQMFNVSALLLDDALKPATPLTNGAINETLRRGAFIGHKVYSVDISSSLSSSSSVRSAAKYR